MRLRATSSSRSTTWSVPSAPSHRNPGAHLLLARIYSAQEKMEESRAVLGDNDPLLVPVLAMVAQAHERGGRGADARVAVKLGLEILASHPDAQAQNELQAVLTRLGNAA
jgi:hypothetical protein